MNTMWFLSLINPTSWGRGSDVPPDPNQDKLIDYLPAGIALVDKDHRIIRVNKMMSQMLKRSADDLEGSFCYQQFAKGAGVCAHCPGLLSAGESQTPQFETQWLRDDGSSICTRLTAVALRDAQGEISGFIKMAEDITAYKLLQQELTASEARYRALFEKSGDHLFVMRLDPERGPVITDANEAAFTSHGYSREELIGKPISFLDSEAARGEISERSIKLQNPGDHLLFESEHRCKDGRLMQVEVSATLVQIGEAAPFLLCVERDISARKRAEAENLRLERQLLQAEKMKALGQLTGGIAHDFNNQLTAILGFTELLEAGVTEPNLKGYVENIRRSAQGSADLIAQLMSFSRKEHPTFVLVDMHRVIRDVAILLKHSLNKKIGVIQQLTAPDAEVRGDAIQLQNALLNIAINARDAMTEGGELGFETLHCAPPPHFSAEQVAGLGARCLCIRIQDNGCGIDAETKARIFEPFFTTKKAGKGTGMGLASVYGAVMGHQGQIEVESTLGVGTSFNLYLPLAVTAARA